MRALWMTVLCALGCSASDPAPSSSDGGAALGDSAAADTTMADDSAVTDSAARDETRDETLAEAAASGDTWESWGKGFFAKYCVECHATSSKTRDYTGLTDVKRDAAEIACGVATTKLMGCASFPPPKQFPVPNATKSNPKPTDAERARLVAWIQAGTP